MTWAVTGAAYSPAQEADMVRNAAAAALQPGLEHAPKLDFGDLAARARLRRGLRLAVSGNVRGPEKYRVLQWKRRRAQIRARRVLGLV